MAPGFPRAHGLASFVYLVQGKHGLALKEIGQESEKTLEPALIYHALGRQQEADKHLSYLINNPSARAYDVASVYAFRGEKEKAFTWLDKAFANRDAFLVFLKNDPLLKNIADDPRYKMLMKKLNLPLD